MAEIRLPEEELGEPALTYWKPVPKPPPPVSLPPSEQHTSWSYQVPTFSQPALLPPSYTYHHPSYPLTDVIHSYIQNQQIRLSPGGLPIEGERRRMSQCALSGTEHLLYSLSASVNYEQDSQTMTDNMIQDELTRAAKTLFSKRNRTLLHWLNPDINKNQIKIDVDATWESLPPAEKMFYVSQVLGRFSPHRTTTSLMVNPQLEPTSMESPSVNGLVVNKRADKTRMSTTRARQKQKKTKEKIKSETDLQIKTEIKTDDEGSRDSNLVMDVGEPEIPKEVGPVEEKPRVKRKYTKRKRKDGASEQNNNSCPLPVDVKDIKIEPNDDLPVDIKDIKVESNAEDPVDFKDIKLEPNNSEGNNKNQDQSNLQPRPKRKYIKRKLVRKKYKKREPKQKPPIDKAESPVEIKSEVNEPEIQQNGEEEMEMDLWIELGNDSVLTNEEVDNFFGSIEDPESFFRELGILDS